MPTIAALLEKMIAAGKPLEQLLDFKAKCPNNCLLPPPRGAGRVECGSCKEQLEHAAAAYAAAEAAFWAYANENRTN
jgi:hypothetical protein